MAWASHARAQEYEYKNRYVEDTKNRKAVGVLSGYKEYEVPMYSDAPVASNDPHVKVLGWDPNVPLPRFINTLKEGETDQLTVLKLFSAPNIITRNVRDNKETWVYQWLWSYADPEDPNNTTIMMDKVGNRLKRNRTPVSMVITFNDNDVVDSYSIKLIKYKRDAFNHK
ncbi:MAG: hypothetical protein U1F57_00065 [bacterium]